MIHQTPPVYSIRGSAPPDETNYSLAAVLPLHEEFLHIEAYKAFPFHVLNRLPDVRSGIPA